MLASDRLALTVLACVALWTFVGLPIIYSPADHEAIKPGEWLIGLGTLALFIATAALWWATRSLVLDARENAERQLRAYVGADGFEYTPVADESDGSRALKWHIHVKWINRGGTPAMNVRSSFLTETFGPEGMPEDFDCKYEAPKALPSEYITPTGAFRSPIVTLDASDLAETLSRNKRIYVWGHIEYSDVFLNTPRHRLEFCDELLVDGAPDQTNCRFHSEGLRLVVTTG
jgi:hypothetical protein